MVSAFLMEQAEGAFASLMDYLVLDLFWQRVILNMETNFQWQASTEDVTASQSPKALLASSHRLVMSMGGTSLLSPGVLSAGE